jgi:probable blue pigment (indigoidine) exporter
LALLVEPALPALNTESVLGLTYLGLIGAAFTYLLWFRGISRIEPSVISTLGFLSPLTALLLGWGLLDQSLTLLQAIGVIAVLISVWLSQFATRRASKSIPVTE